MRLRYFRVEVESRERLGLCVSASVLWRVIFMRDLSDPLLAVDVT